MPNKHTMKERPIGMILIISLLIGFLIAVGVYQHSSSKQAELLYAFFDSASKSTSDVDKYTLSFEKLKSARNLNFNPDYYHDGNASVQDIIENFKVDLKACKVDIERYHTFYPLGDEITEHSFSSYLNPIYVHSLVFQCIHQKKDIAFIGYSFMRSDILGIHHKVYKVVFPEL